MFYWGRIKRFHISSFNVDTISSNVCETLRICCPNQHLFPNLRELDWFDEDPSRLSIIALFLSPRIYSISMYPGESMILLSLLPTLAVKYPNLTEMNLRSFYRHSRSYGPELLDALFAFVSNAKRLEVLCIEIADVAILERSSRFPSLKTLVVDEIFPFESFPNGDGSDPRFPSLEELSLWGTTPEISTTVVRAVENRALTAIHLLFESNFPDAAATANPYYGFNLDDETVSKMARAWPRVEELRLAFSVDMHAADVLTRVTLVGVHGIATHCLHLKTLELCFDASIVPPLESIPAETKLTELDVLCSPISSPTAVAKFLSHIFPKLGALDYQPTNLERAAQTYKQQTQHYYMTQTLEDKKKRHLYYPAQKASADIFPWEIPMDTNDSATACLNQCAAFGYTAGGMELGSRWCKSSALQFNANSDIFKTGDELDGIKSGFTIGDESGPCTGDPVHLWDPAALSDAISNDLFIRDNIADIMMTSASALDRFTAAPARIEAVSRPLRNKPHSRLSPPLRLLCLQHGHSPASHLLRCPRRRRRELWRACLPTN
ncbi:hypothetical protein B0H19DRAFT_1058494 [Mycena capillaripes]|nr:hypothetical protein B0H19DRAFT_1058494 [Mycena capillaripes]